MITRLRAHLLLDTLVEELFGMRAYILRIKNWIPLIILVAVSVPQVHKIAVLALKVPILDKIKVDLLI